MLNKSHPNIIRLIEEDPFFDKQKLYPYRYVSYYDYYPGGDLTSLIDEEDRSQLTEIMIMK